ncbi:hypothetical protein [Flavivirga aquatica]|uniref:hypothetical protein n=1 Tax=Flavivirga aquatica TaxID=1849968 RepID=UPI000F4E76BD|nr:hypothetical protein [Flavivirga aquatica]
MSPIINFDLVIGDKKDSVLTQLDVYNIVSGKRLKYIPENVKAYTGNKSIVLPNGYKTQVRFNLHFKKGVLVKYNLTFNIGDNYKYFWELIDYLKINDKKNINSFIYSVKDNLPSYTDLFKDNNCKRFFSVVRSSDDEGVFEISCKVN